MHPLRALREAGPPTPEQVSEILSSDVIFNSPLLTHPIEGKAAVAQTISNSARSRDGVGEYVGEYKLDDRTTFLRWKGTIEGHKFESFEVLVDDDHGKLVERTIAYRPFPSVAIFREKMRALAGNLYPAEWWEWPK